MGGLGAVRGWGVTRVWVFGRGCDEKNIVPGPRCLMGVWQAMQKNRELLSRLCGFLLSSPSILTQGYVQAMQKIGETCITPMWDFAVFPLATDARL